MNTLNKIFGGLIVLFAAFLLGFVPQYVQRDRSQDQLESCRKRTTSLEFDLDVAELRNLAGMTMLEVSRQNYGLAKEHAGQYFEKVRTIAGTAGEPVKQSLQDLLGIEEATVASLAQADASTASAAQTLYVRTYETTAKLTEAGK